MIQSMSESDLKAFYQLAHDKQASGSSVYALEPDELDWMHAIADEESVSGLMALHLLSVIDGAGYYEDIPVIDEEEFQAERFYNEPLLASAEWMMPSPNPANTDIMILFAPEFSSDGSQLIMTDVSGHIVWSCIIPDDFTSVTIPVDQLSSGIYLLQLKSDDQLLETQKLVVSR